MTATAQEIPRIGIQGGQVVHVAERAISEQLVATDAQTAWDQSLGIQKRLDGEHITIYARDREGELRRMEVHDRPGGFYALSYQDSQTDTVYTTRVTGAYLDRLPLSDYVGPHIDWRRQRDLAGSSSATQRRNRR